ncbi:PAQR family membrane homeostasis protein TrhA [Alloalcanivorax profundimaris]|uniref:PAQR family membrane homeostasis protein TrhA n=1 Tax=Alloalcanivorax profundimaris TaxID=2735259 RepID=UPI001887F070|nr:hemolysin III family protein [Alloalcanivorax profundimaris]MBF1803084.1 hemolysin III family protein [Alloalcanivorax profundimaris]
MASRHDAATADYSLLEEFLNSLTHGLGLVLSLVGTAVLVVAASLLGDPWKIVSFSVFGATLALLYAASMLYHGSRRPRLRAVYKMLDHCAIFALIAGTYTPFLLVNMRGPVGWTLFGVIWGLAATGIILKLVFGNRYKLARVAIYLAMGWLVLFASGELVDSIDPLGFWLLLAGGITYTAGVIFYLADRIPYNHAIWHLFVVGGSACHFAAVYFSVLPA